MENKTRLVRTIFQEFERDIPPVSSTFSERFSAQWPSYQRSDVVPKNMTRDLAARVKLVNEPTYSFGSADNPRRYDTEIDLTGGCQASSIHGLIIDDRPTLIIGDSGGASGVHEHSLLFLDSQIYVAVGAHVVCLTLGSEHPDWTLEIDEATCFGLYYAPEHDALISHGELEIARFSRDGKILWSEGGADIFSEGISLHGDCIEAIDFDRRSYFFDYATGKSTRHNKALDTKT